MENLDETNMRMMAYLSMLSLIQKGAVDEWLDEIRVACDVREEKAQRSQ